MFTFYQSFTGVTAAAREEYRGWFPNAGFKSSVLSHFAEGIITAETALERDSAAVWQKLIRLGAVASRVVFDEETPDFKKRRGAAS